MWPNRALNLCSLLLNRIPAGPVHYTDDSNFGLVSGGMCARGNLQARSAETVWSQFIADEIAGLWLFLPISRTLVEMSCTRLGALPPNVPCRATDALHLTCAAEEGFAEIYSNDRHLLAAAAHFGLTGKNVIS
jgi:hypothetical protein